MGSACCVAARDRTITDRSGTSDVLPRNDRYSPSWSFRWDNRGRVAGEEESSVNCFSDGPATNERLDNKSHTTTLETPYATEEGSPLDSSRSLTWQKSSPSEELGFPHPDPLTSKNLHEGKLSPTKMSHSTSSLSASPLSSSQGHLPPLSTLTPSRWPRRSPGHHLLRQVSDSRIRGIMSPNFSISEEGSPFMHHHQQQPGWSSNKSNRGSHGSLGGSHGGSSSPTYSYSELMAYANSKRWSFDSESLSFSRDRISRSSGGIASSSSSIDITQTCGVCSKVLTERSSFSSQKFVANNGLPVVAVLICGHVYHSECLENMTPEINKYDPACPVCTFGEKKVHKMSEKAMGVEMDLKSKIGKLRRRVIDGDSVIFDRLKSRGGGPKMGSSSSMKSSTGNGKPFLKRHFSFGYKPSRSVSDNGSRKKRFFWSKSSKE